jgi:hypothetical protein
MITERRGAELNRCTGLCRPLPNHSATPPTEKKGPDGGPFVSSGRRDSNPRPSPWQGPSVHPRRSAEFILAGRSGCERGRSSATAANPRDEAI